MLRPFARASLLVLPLAVALAACDAVSDGDQNLFEDQAYFSPVGTASGWPVGPAFNARMRVLRPPTPNPAGPTDEVFMQLDVDVPAPGGFTLRRLEADGRLLFVASVDGVNGPSFYTFTFPGRRVDELGRSGTYRLLVLDGSDRVVTYGDFVLQ